MSRLVLSALFAVCCAAIAKPAEAPPPGMALIPPGNYSPLSGGKNEPRLVRVPAFFLDLRPVTNAEFLRFVTANPSWRRSAVSPLFAETSYLAGWADDLELGAQAPADAPVVQVSWFAARAYARWRGSRLPTIAEWERAAAAGFTTENGAGEPAYREAALKWLSVPTPARLAPAGSGRADFHGVHDLTGLVWEWVSDFGAAGLGGDGGADRNLVCGGAAAGVSDFTNYPAFLRAEFRASLAAPYAVPNLGFRCARSL